MGKTRSLRGQLLVASPGLTDPNFLRTVVLVAEHTRKGALGLVLNRPTDLRLTDLWSKISDDPTPIETDACAFLGGPVQRNAVLVLHGHDDLAEGEAVVPGVYLGSDVDLLSELLRRTDDHGRPRDLRVFCGYAGWGAGQLDQEMSMGGWLTVAATRQHVFTEPPKRLWTEALSSLGGIYRLLSEIPPNPELN